MYRKRILSEAETVHLPAPPPRGVTPGGFVLCPVFGLPPLSPEQWVFCQMIYRRALEEAQAVVRPSLPERDLLAVWN